VTLHHRARLHRRACLLIALSLGFALPAAAQEALPAAAQEAPRDRFEIGVAAVEGYFDWIGAFGYRRFLRTGGPFEQAIQIELAGAAKGYLSEGALSVAYLLRPIKSYRSGWRIRPLLEAGPAAHVVMQVADIRGFDDTGFHAHAYLKMHAFGGVEALLGRRWGLSLRGRFTTPAHRPLDYAHAAIFFR
jgi:hypothetical protein